jgi:hypothetical protein
MITVAQNTFNILRSCFPWTFDSSMISSGLDASLLTETEIFCVAISLAFRALRHFTSCVRLLQFYFVLQWDVYIIYYDQLLVLIPQHGPQQSLAKSFGKVRRIQSSSLVCFPFVADLSCQYTIMRVSLSSPFSGVIDLIASPDLPPGVALSVFGFFIACLVVTTEVVTVKSLFILSSF